MLVEGQLAGDNFHSYTHDVEVSIERNGAHYRFIMFFKHHVRLEVNRCMAALAQAQVRGDVLVVACGPRVGARGMRAGETKAADFAVAQCVPSP